MPPIDFGNLSNRYGPKIGAEFDPKYFDIYHYLRPSEGDIRRAIQTLSNPEEVSCETLETILAMEWTPTYLHLELLLEPSKPGIFPTCIKLLRSYCEVEGHGIFDHAYGFLCLQVVVLCLEVAKLAREEVVGLVLARLPKFTGSGPLSLALNHLSRKIESSASFYTNEPIQNNKHKESFGWYQNPATGDFECLPSIGGCHLRDIHFLMNQMWPARKQIFRLGKWAVDKFLGWTGFFYASWQIMLENSIRTNSVSTGGKSPEERRCWSQFVELLLRYELLPHPEEIENHILDWLMQCCPEPVLSIRTEGVTVVDDEDADRTVAMYLAKVKATPRFGRGQIFSLFGYTCTNIKQGNFEKDFPRLVTATYDRGFLDLLETDFDARQWKVFVETSVNLLATFVGAWKQPSPKRTQFVVSVALKSDLLEYFGRLFLFPLSIHGESIMKITKDWDSTDPREIMSSFMVALQHEALGTGVETSEDLFLVWWKVYERFGDLRGSLSSTLELEYTKLWEPFWLLIGHTLGLSDLVFVIRCAYPRCNSADTLVGWECNHCEATYYCSKDCQRADWDQMPWPHKLDCENLRAAEHQYPKRKVNAPTIYGH